MNTKFVYNYKTADDALSERIDALENVMGLGENETLESVMDAKVSSAKTELTGTISANQAEVEGKLAELQTQIDGAVSTWFEKGVPALDRAPAVSWTSPEEKAVHLGDVYYDTDTGYAYRFMATGEGENAEYSWGLIKDSDVTRALADSQEALDGLEECVKIRQGANAVGMMLMVDEDGEVAPEIPNRLLLTDVSGEKTFILQLETDGSLSILEET